MGRTTATSVDSWKSTDDVFPYLFNLFTTSAATVLFPAPGGPAIPTRCLQINHQICNWEEKYTKHKVSYHSKKWIQEASQFYPRKEIKNHFWRPPKSAKQTKILSHPGKSYNDLMHVMLFASKFKHKSLALQFYERKELELYLLHSRDTFWCH